MTDADDQRSRPQYGEYASPDEQRARIRQPEYERIPLPGEQVAAMPPPTPAAPPVRRVDRIVTMVLLGYGLFTVVTAIPTLLDYQAYARALFEAVGIDVAGFDPNAGGSWPMGSALVLAFGWLITAYVSWVLVRAGKAAFWVPLVGGILFNTLSALLMLVPIMSDPAIFDALRTLQTG